MRILSAKGHSSLTVNEDLMDFLKFVRFMAMRSRSKVTGLGHVLWTTFCDSINILTKFEEDRLVTFRVMVTRSFGH